MGILEREARAFLQAKRERISQARQNAAFFLISGIDLSVAQETEGEERAALLVRLGRLIERERLKGMRRHWSYDLNRHIALKQAYDCLKPPREEDLKPRPPRQPRRRRMPAGGNPRQSIRRCGLLGFPRVRKSDSRLSFGGSHGRSGPSDPAG